MLIPSHCAQQEEGMGGVDVDPSHASHKYMHRTALSLSLVVV